MKIAQITISYIGAQRKIVDSIYRALRNDGHICKIFYFNKIKTEKHHQDAACLNTDFSYFWFRVLRRLAGNQSWIAAYQTRKLIKALNKLSPDIFHLHVLHNGAIDYMRLFRFISKTGKPVVWTIHDMWGHTGGCYHYTKAGCTQFTQGCYACPKPDHELDNPAAQTHRRWSGKKEIYNQMDSLHLVAVSEWVCDQLGLSILQKFPRRVIYNGLDQQEISISDEVAAKITALSLHGQFIILAVANYWDNAKGIDDARALAEELGGEYRLVLVGSFQENIKLPENAVLWGYETPDNLGALFRLAALHVSFSKEETFGMTFLEAALEGTKSIGYNSTAIGEVLEKLHGYVVAPGDVQAMAQIIRGCKAGVLPCKLSGDEQKSLSVFSGRDMAALYLDVYAEAVSGSHASNNTRN